MRHYSFLASRPGGFMNWPSLAVTTSMRIRPLAVILFRKWFGREPNLSFGFDGWFARAEDERGNVITVEQDNHRLTEQWHTLDPRLFALFTQVGPRLVPYVGPAHQIAWCEKEAA